MQDKNLSTASPQESDGAQDAPRFAPLFPVPAGWRVLQVGDVREVGDVLAGKDDTEFDPGETVQATQGWPIAPGDALLVFRRIEAVEAKPEPSKDFAETLVDNLIAAAHRFAESNPADEFHALKRDAEAEHRGNVIRALQNLTPSQNEGAA